MTHAEITSHLALARELENAPPTEKNIRTLWSAYKMAQNIHRDVPQLAPLFAELGISPPQMNGQVDDVIPLTIRTLEMAEIAARLAMPLVAKEWAHTCVSAGAVNELYCAYMGHKPQLVSTQRLNEMAEYLHKRKCGTNDWHDKPLVETWIDNIRAEWQSLPF
jgi:hypothetical protein